MLFEYATTLAAEISFLQCRQMRTATLHLSIRTPNNKRCPWWKKSRNELSRCFSPLKLCSASSSVGKSGKRTYDMRPTRRKSS